MKWVRNRETAKEILAKDGKALQYCSEEMKGDRELCTAAVAQDWRAHKYATKEVQQEENIKAVVMEAVLSLIHI